MNSLEYLKSCTTNVAALEHLSNIEYLCCEIHHSNESDASSGTLVLQIRQQNVLCMKQADDIWLFGDDGAELGRIVDSHAGVLSIKEKGTLERNQEIPRNNFLLAVQGAITLVLASEHSMVLVDYFTWCSGDHHGLSEDGSGAGAVLVQVQPRISENDSLFLSTSTRPSHLVPCTPTSQRDLSKVTLAPTGRTARVVKSDGDEESGNAKPVLRGAHFTTAVIQYLMEQSIEIHSDEKWFLVELDGAMLDHRFLWPARLCLMQHITKNRATINKPRDWKYWFSVADDQFRDPLAAAEAWYFEESQRETVVPSSVPNPMLLFDNVASVSSIIPETPLAIASPYNQRIIDQQAVMSGIYPTPPDGLMPHPGNFNPTSEGHSSAMQIESEEAAQGPEPPSSGEIAGRGTSMESARDGQGYEPHSDDLFGDMGEIEFGGNEVDDADFDYFDEPDDEPTGVDVDMTGDEPSRDTDQSGLDGAAPLTTTTPSVLIDEVPNLTSSPIEISQTTAGHDHQTNSMQPVGMGEAHADAIPPFMQQAYKPLDRFAIKERLLPRPIPASIMKGEKGAMESHRRKSTFDAMAFGDNVVLSERYNINYQSRTKNLEIFKPAKAKKGRTKPVMDPDSGDTDQYSTSEDNSYDSMTTVSDTEDLPPKLPWDTKKRKRTDQASGRYVGEIGGDVVMLDAEIDADERLDETSIPYLLTSVLRGKSTGGFQPLEKPSHLVENGKSLVPSGLSATSKLREVMELTDQQLVMIAQVVCEQAISVTRALVTIGEGITCDEPAGKAFQAALQTTVDGLLLRILPDIDGCSVSKLALIKEPPPRPTVNPGKASQPGHPRPPHREGSMQLGPDYFGLSAPYVRVQRGAETWEMLPPAIDFWGALSLGPAGGVKDVTAIFIAPDNEDLLKLLPSFMQDLTNSYESRKLGNFNIKPDLTFDPETDSDADMGFDMDEYFIKVGISADLVTAEAVIKAYAVICEQLGRSVERLGRDTPDRTIVVCIVDPFENEASLKWLCACFWKLFVSCRQAAQANSRQTSRSDLVLQILPVSLFASPDDVVVLDSNQLAALAMEIYDRCPPSSKATTGSDLNAMLPIGNAPAIELAAVPPKRITFQLTADPPGDLMHEGSVLHLAYTLSNDRQWLAVTWIDATGRSQMTTTTCLQGKSMRDAFTEMWERSRDIMHSRDVTWRVFIVTPGNVDHSLQQCWKDLAGTEVKKQILHVTLLSIQDDPAVQLTPPTPAEFDQPLAASSTQGAGFLTPPVTTPSGMTVSPDASGSGGYNPPTPAPTDTTAAETDPDAHLADMADESWGMLLAPSFPVETSPSEDSTASPLARGLLFRRGNAHTSNPSHELESLSVNLYWDVRFRPGGLVDEGPSRQAEMTLRDVLRMYRNLGLLGRLRNLSLDGDGDGGRKSIVPLHVVCAVKAARALSGYLD